MATTTKPAADAETEAIAASMEAHGAAVKAKQSTARAASRPTPKPEPAAKAKPAARIASLVAWRAKADAPAEVLEVVDAAIKRGSATPRSVMVKAEPAVVAAFFASTGLSRKEIAEAVGVTTSVIGTVTKENGDRWSLARFELAKPLILAAAKAKAKAVKPTK
jgi:hypothetical protein